VFACIVFSNRKFAKKLLINFFCEIYPHKYDWNLQSLRVQTALYVKYWSAKILCERILKRLYSKKILSWQYFCRKIERKYFGQNIYCVRNHTFWWKFLFANPHWRLERQSYKRNLVFNRLNNVFLKSLAVCNFNGEPSFF